MITAELAQELHETIILLMTKHSELRRKYGLSPDFVNEDDKRAYGILVSVLESATSSSNGKPSLNDIYKSLMRCHSEN